MPIAPHSDTPTANSPEPQSRKPLRWWHIAGSGTAGFALGIGATVGAAYGIAALAEPEPATEAATTTETATIDPADWETLADMQRGLDIITGECSEATESEDGIGYCSNGNALLTYGIGFSPTLGVSRAAVSPITESEGYLVHHDDWAVYCAVTVGDDLAHPYKLCSQIQDAFPGAGWSNAEAADKAQEETLSEAPTETTPPEPATTFTDGTHMVGSDIQPGTYRNAGNETCYWARLSGLGGTVEDIIANENPRGQAFVTIGADDAAFKSQLCGTWELVE